MSVTGFTRGQPFVVDEEDLVRPWDGRGAAAFLCGMCMTHFAVGDTARWVYSPPDTPNTFVCVNCDGPDIRARWADRWRNVITPILRRWAT